MDLEAERPADKVFDQLSKRELVRLLQESKVSLRLCRRCAKRFLTEDTRRHYCSVHCARRKSQVKVRGARHYGNVVVVCATCAKPIRKSWSKAARVKHNHYCSLECKPSNRQVFYGGWDDGTNRPTDQERKNAPEEKG